MAIKGVTFPNVNVTSDTNDGTFYNACNSDGILYGCTMTTNSTQLKIAAGLLMVSGRQIEVDSYTDITFTNFSDEYGRVILDITNNTVTTTTDTSNTVDGFSALTQQDINHGGTTYQVALAIVHIVGGAIVGIEKTIGKSGLISNGTLTANASIETDGNIGFINSAGASRYIRFRNNGVLEGAIRHNPSTYMNFAYYDSNAVSQTGIQARADGVTILYGNGTDNIYLRPNGLSNNTGQAIVYPSGDFKANGGIIGTSATISGNTSIGGTLNVSSFDASSNIHIDRSGSGTRSLVIRDNGDAVAAFGYNGTYTRCANTDSGGNLVAGMQAKSDTAMLFANGGTIYFRPNGATSTSHQAYITSGGVLNLNGGLTIDGDVTITNGKLTGGNSVVSKPQTSSVSLSGTTASAIVTQTGLTSSGIYMVEGHLTYTAGAATGHHPQIRIGSSATADLNGRNGAYIASTGGIYLQVFAIMTGVSQVVLSCTCDASGMTATVTNGSLRIVRVG